MADPAAQPEGAMLSVVSEVPVAAAPPVGAPAAAPASDISNSTQEVTAKELPSAIPSVMTSREKAVVPDTWTSTAVDATVFLNENSLKSPMQVYEDFDPLRYNENDGQEKPPTTAMLLPKNSHRNRYENIPCIDTTRVILNDSYVDDYIHANWVDSFSVKKAFILTQGPVVSTVIDFWRMVWQEQVKVIVCLTRLKEDHWPKCAAYWPQILSEVHRHGEDIFVMQQARNELGFYDHTELWLGVQQAGKKEVTNRNVHLLHVHAWADNCLPELGDLLELIRKKMHELNRNMYGVEDTPIVIHCGGGVGRSGTLALYDMLVEQIQLTGKINVTESLNMIRRQRPMAVLEVEHYLSLHLALIFYMVHEMPNAPKKLDIPQPGATVGKYTLVKKE